jgi:hypothetical protein
MFKDKAVERFRAADRVPRYVISMQSDKCRGYLKKELIYKEETWFKSNDQSMDIDIAPWHLYKISRWVDLNCASSYLIGPDALPW